MKALSIILTAEQTKAVDALIDFIQDPNPPSPFFTFAGYAGTGKTFCMREVVARTAGSNTKFAYTAPTNKAAKVLRAITGEAGTIYSLLGLRIDKSGELKKVVSGKAPTDLKELDVVFIDEGSMVNSVLLKELTAAVERFGFKVVFMGDQAQLPPVGETQSPIWNLRVGASLQQVMRHENQILDLATSIRAVVNSPAPCIDIKSSFNDDGGVWKMTKAQFKQTMHKAAVAGLFADGAVSKVIAWRNVKVKEYNDLIRDALWGIDSQEKPWVPGERVVAAAPCERNDEVLMITDEEAIVQSVRYCKHPMEPKYGAIQLTCTTENGQEVNLLVIDPASQKQYEEDCRILAGQAQNNGRLWKNFWNLKEIFHDIRYAYAITAHRAQGSTYEQVWVDYQDILLNRTRKEAFQCLYVACSRPTTRLFLA